MLRSQGPVLLVALSIVLLSLRCQSVALSQVRAPLPPSNFVKVLASTLANTSDPGLNFTFQGPRYGSQGYLAVISNPTQHFHIYYPKTGDGLCGNYCYPNATAQTCGGWEYTSVQSLSNKCLFAVNAGPFNFKSSNLQPCRGKVVSDSRVLMIEDTVEGVFGVTTDGYLVMGDIRAGDIPGLKITQLVSGFGVLVNNGKPTVKPGGEIAPRVAVGIDKFGRVMLFEADGDESLHLGLTNRQVADWMISLGAVHVLDFDGGGSAVAIYGGKVISVPTCRDIPYPHCERRVATIACIR